jgi:hypothetical protein
VPPYWLLTESRELGGEQVSLTLCEVSDRLELVDLVLDQEPVAPRATPLALTCEELRYWPSARLHRTVEDDLGGGQVSGADPFLESRACAPDLIRSLKRQHALLLRGVLERWRHFSLPWVTYDTRTPLRPPTIDSRGAAGGRG